MDRKLMVYKIYSFLTVVSGSVVVGSSCREEPARKIATATRTRRDGEDGSMLSRWMERSGWRS